MTPRRRAAAASLLPFYAVLLAALVGLPVARSARAATEEFSTFGLFQTEEDDESTIDHILTVTPIPWRERWDRSRLAVRVSQGCFTSGQWIIDSDLKLSTAIGSTATFGVYDRRYEADDGNWNYTDLFLRFPTRYGAFGGYFRPYHDKSRQDFGAFWDTGNDSLGLQSRLVFTIEDTFNNLWAFRQARVGDLSEPYERHPYELALHVVDREPWVRWEVSGKYLTPSRQQVIADPTAADYRTATLWGIEGAGSAEVRALGLTWLGNAQIKQARSVDDIHQPPDEAGDRWRNAWGTDAGVRVVPSFFPRMTAEGHWMYRMRIDSDQAPGPDVALKAIDRVAWADSWTSLTPALDLRLGYIYDRISVYHSPYFPYWTWGHRRESRAYVGLTARFGNFQVSGLEGIELDTEQYDVWLWHDKGFITLQATF